MSLIYFVCRIYICAYILRSRSTPYVVLIYKRSPSDRSSHPALLWLRTKLNIELFGYRCLHSRDYSAVFLFHLRRRNGELHFALDPFIASLAWGLFIFLCYNRHILDDGNRFGSILHLHSTARVL